MKNELITVLDLGSTKAACLAAKLGEDGALQILATATVDCKGVRRGVVSDLEHTASAVDAAVRKVQQAIGEDIESVVVSIGGQHLEGLNAQGFVPIYPRSRPITRDDVLQVINHSRQITFPADREPIQALPREFRVDGQRGIARPVGMIGSKLEVTTYMVTGQIPHVQNLEKAIAMAGKKVEAMVLEPLASGLGVLSPQDMELGAAVVDIGGGTTDVAVFANGSIHYSACLPVGGQLVTSDLSKLLKTSPEEAERLKVEGGMAMAKLAGEEEGVDVLQLGQTQKRPMQRRVMCEIVESRMREIATLVKQQLEKSGMYSLLPGGVVLTGGGSSMPGAQQLFEDVMPHLRVRKAAPKVGGPAGPAASRSEMAVAVGLARFTLDSADDELATITDNGSWKHKVRTFWSQISGKN